jgi:hypothetical protein
MKQFLHPKHLQLFYCHNKTTEIKSLTIPWEDIVKFEVEDIKQSIKTKNQILIKFDTLLKLDLVAKNVICDNEPKTDLRLYQILPYSYELYEIDIIDNQNQHHVFAINEHPNSLYQSREFNDFEISIK